MWAALEAQNIELTWSGSSIVREIKASGLNGIHNNCSFIIKVEIGYSTKDSKHLCSLMNHLSCRSAAWLKASKNHA